MMNHDLMTYRNLAIIFIFTVLFGTSAFDKFKSLSAPEWFIKQFKGTLISKLPGGATLGYWMIAGLELLLTLAFVGSIFNPVLLSCALLGSLFMFGILCLGLRLISDFQGSANMFVYFTATLVSFWMIHAA